jgi:GT2 family glycosyltransferase
MKVSILLASLDNIKFLRDCIRVTKKNTKVQTEFIVMDLGDDGTDLWCEKNKIKVLRHDLPCYYSKSNNLLAKEATGDYLLFLNPDTLPNMNFLEEMLKEMTDDVGIVGARLMYPNGTVQASAIHWDDQDQHPGDPWYLSRIEPEMLAPKDALVSGACMLVKKEVFKKIGGFDEKFKNGYEDIDLCLAAKEKGYRVRYCGRAEVTHYHGKAGGTQNNPIPTALEYLEDNLKHLRDKWRKPEKTYTDKIYINHGKWSNRLLIGTAVTGHVRIEWHLARTGAIIPTNWSNAYATPILPTSAPMGYTTADAQNIIVRDAIVGEYQWLLLLEQDNVVPPDVFIRFNEYMRNENVPVVSGLYFTKSDPPEPMVYGRSGNSFNEGWKMGDKIWVWGVPTGCVLIHGSVLKAMWDVSPEYELWGNRVRRVFEAPAKVWYDPQKGYQSAAGTSDLNFCNQVIEKHIFKKAGWSEYDNKPRPFLCDTNIFCWHIRDDGVKFPIVIPERFRK